jgi:hypothetical protein
MRPANPVEPAEDVLMRLLKRLFGVLAFLLGFIGLLASLAGIVGCWYAYFDLLDREKRLYAKSEETLTTANKSLVKVRDRLREAREQVDAIRQREADLKNHPPEEQTRRRARSRLEAKAAQPQLDEARGFLVNSTETALVVNGLLDALSDLPGLDRTGLEPERLKEASKNLGEATEKAETLSQTLATQTGPLSQQDLEVSAKIAALLDKIIATIDAGVNWTDRTRDRVREWHLRFEHYLFLSALGITFVLIWIGLAQYSLMMHGYSWARGFVTVKPGAAPPDTGHVS